MGKHPAYFVFSDPRIFSLDSSLNLNNEQAKFYGEVEKHLLALGKKFNRFFKAKNSPCFLPVDSVVFFYFNNGKEITAETPVFSFKIESYSMEIFEGSDTGDGESQVTYINIIPYTKAAVSPEKLARWLAKAWISREEQYPGL